MSSIVCRAFKFKNQVHTRYLMPVTTVHTWEPGTSARKGWPYRTGGTQTLVLPGTWRVTTLGLHCSNTCGPKAAGAQARPFSFSWQCCVQCQPLEAVSGHRADYKHTKSTFKIQKTSVIMSVN